MQATRRLANIVLKELGDSIVPFLGVLWFSAATSLVVLGNKWTIDPVSQILAIWATSGSVAAFLPVPVGLLRAVRIAAGAAATSAGALLTVSLGVLGTNTPSDADTRYVTVALMTIAAGALGLWSADLRIATATDRDTTRAREADAAATLTRHAEVLSAIHANHPCTARTRRRHLAAAIAAGLTIGAWVTWTNRAPGRLRPEARR